MIGQPPDSSERDQQWSEVLVACLKAIDAGQAPDRQALAARYPEFAGELEQFFAQHDYLGQLAAPLRTAVRGPQAPRAFGDYEDLEEIGQGGMGVVYKARQRSLNRLVALKMMRAGSSALPAEVQRFRQEAELVAHLDHPHIVPIHDVGECEGRLYFSMKLIEGGSLAQTLGRGPWAVDRTDQPRRAAQLLATVARAVHYAHQRGILHRDLKPANILVDAGEQPHVTDFGLAKRVPGLGWEPGETVLSHSGELVGTPSYMAPEQASGRREAVTTATDVHGLGATLYALLTGRPPFRAETPLDTLNQVRSQEPEKPSRINPRVDRDLETICLKCLEKEPQRRYGSAEALAEDLERWLEGEPIQARSVTRRERVWRWCRRNPVVASLTAAVVLLLVVTVVGLSVSTVQTKKAYTAEAKQRRRADKHFREAREAVDQMLSRVGEKRLADIPQMTAVRRELLEEALAFYERFVQEESDDPTARQDLGKAHLRIGVLQNDLGRQDKAREAFQNGQAVFEQLTTDFPDRADYWLDLARCYEGPAWEGLDDPVEGERAHRRALAIRERLASEHPTEPGYLNDLAQNYNSLAFQLERIAKFDDAEQAYRRAVDIAETLHAHHADVADYRKTLAGALAGLGQRLLDAGRYTEAEPLLRRALMFQQELTKEFPRDFGYRETLGYWYWHLGKLLEKTGSAHDAEEAYKSALAIQDQLAVDFPGLPANRAQAAIVRARSLGPLLYSRSRFSEAEQAYRQALDTYQKLAAEFPSGFMYKLARVNLGETYGNLGEMLLQIGRRDEAKQAYAQEEAITRKAAEDFPDVAVNRNNLAECLHKQGELLQIDGRLPEAEQMFLRSLAVQEKVVAEWPTEPSYRVNLAIVHLRLAIARSLAGRRAEAESDFRRAVTLWDKLIADSPADPTYRQQLSLFLAAFPDAKLRDPRRAVELIQPVLKQQPDDTRAWITLGIARCRLGEWQSAIEALNKSAQLRSGATRDEWFYVAMAQAHLGQKEQARKSHERAVQWMEKNRPKDPELRHLREEVDNELGKGKRQ
jgi:serine/threonine-protein kinase